MKLIPGKLYKISPDNVPDKVYGYVNGGKAMGHIKGSKIDLDDVFMFTGEYVENPKRHIAGYHFEEEERMNGRFWEFLGCGQSLYFEDSDQKNLIEATPNDEEPKEVPTACPVPAGQSGHTLPDRFIVVANNPGAPKIIPARAGAGTTLEEIQSHSPVLAQELKKGNWCF